VSGPQHYLRRDSHIGRGATGMLPQDARGDCEVRGGHHNPGTTVTSFSTSSGRLSGRGSVLARVRRHARPARDHPRRSCRSRSADLRSANLNRTVPARDANTRAGGTTAVSDPLWAEQMSGVMSMRRTTCAPLLGVVPSARAAGSSPLRSCQNRQFEKPLKEADTYSPLILAALMIGHHFSASAL
jgi:hypothetical protein